MNDNRMKRWMDAIDDDLLEEAQRPLPAAARRAVGALAACFCAAALALALWQPWSAGIGDNTAGADADFGAMDKSFSVAMPPALDAELLSASLALPEGASPDLRLPVASGRRGRRHRCVLYRAAGRL